MQQMQRLPLVHKIRLEQVLQHQRIVVLVSNLAGYKQHA